MGNDREDQDSYAESALSSLGIGIAAMDGEGRVLYWSPEMARQSGIGADEARSRLFWELYPDFLGSDAPLPAAFKALLGPEGGEIATERPSDAARGSSYERRLKSEDRGGQRIVLASSAEIRGGDGARREAAVSAFSLDDDRATFWEWESRESSIKANAAWARRFSVPEHEGRYRLEDYLGRIHPDDLPRVRESIEDLKSDRGGPMEMEYRLRESGGGYAWILERVMLLERGKGGALERCVGRSADVTRRKELEYSINEKSKLLREVIDQSPFCVFVRDSSGRFVLVNRSMAQFYGKEPGELIGSELLAAHPDREEARRLLAEDGHVLRTGETLLLPETSLTGADGRVRAMEITLMPFSSPGLSEASVLGFCVDITDMKRAQSELSGQKERLAVTLRSIGEGVIATDLSGRVVLMNSMAQALTGWEEGEALGKPIGEVFRARRGGEWSAIDDPAAEPLRQRRVVASDRETYLERRSGGFLEIVLRGAPIIGEDGEVDGAVMVFQDVTERRAMERELEKVQKAEALGILAGGIAHDFNNILMTVLGNISLAKMDMDEGDENWRILADSEKAVLHAKSLTAQLSMMAKGGSELKRESVPFEPLVREACALNLRGSKAECEIDFEEGIGRLSVDPAQMAQVLSNLVINAKEAMPEGGKIRVRASRIALAAGALPPLKPGAYLRLDVTDEGLGIPAEVAQRVFDPYFTTKNRGSGLGLTVCFSVVKKHGGTITVDSKPGEGATFSVYLPYLE